MAKNKKAKIFGQPSGGKQAIIIESVQSQDEKFPSWRFNRWDKEFPKSHCPSQTIQGIFERLSSCEGLTWREIKSASGGKTRGTNSHYLKVEDLDPKVKNRAKVIHLDVDEVFSLRIDGRHRIFGILEEGVFHIIWDDPEHEICKSNKKHT